MSLDTDPVHPLDSLLSLVVITRAAHRAGDHSLESAARELLREHHNLDVSVIDGPCPLTTNQQEGARG